MVEMSKLNMFLLYTALVYGVFATIASFTDGINTQEALLVIVMGPVCAFIGMQIHSKGSAFLTGLMTGGSFTSAKPTPSLGKARVHMQKEEWTEARAELETQWTSFPGNGEVLREFERCLLDGMKAPSGIVDFYRKALPQIKGADRAYVFLRLAEINVDHLGNKGEAHMWCSRLLAEFPSSDHAETVRVIAEQTKPRRE